MDTLQETVKQAQWGSGKLIKKYIDVFTANNLEADEQLIDMAVPSGRPTDLLFITDKRIFYFKMNSEDSSHNKVIGYEEIQSIQLDGDEEKADIIIDSAQGRVKINRVFLPIAEEVEKTINSKKDLM